MTHIEFVPGSHEIKMLLHVLNKGSVYTVSYS